MYASVSCCHVKLKMNRRRIVMMVLYSAHNTIYSFASCPDKYHLPLGMYQILSMCSIKIAKKKMEGNKYHPTSSQFSLYYYIHYYQRATDICL